MGDSGLTENQALARAEARLTMRRMVALARFADEVDTLVAATRGLGPLANVAGFLLDGLDAALDAVARDTGAVRGRAPGDVT